VIEDARGVKFLLELELPGYAELESGADAITSRLLWAAGYHVPEDHVVYVYPRDLVIGSDAKYVDVFGNERALRPDDVARLLARAELDGGGRLRGLASRFLGGRLLGGHPAEGRRVDDPNDLRGAYALFAWLDHTDVKEANTLDPWIAESGRHCVEHYIVDFGKCLGVSSTIARNMRLGHAYWIDFSDMARSTAGLTERPRPILSSTPPAHRRRSSPCTIGQSPSMPARPRREGSAGPDRDHAEAARSRTTRPRVRGMRLAPRPCD
jgi:hypothetical protein